MKKFIWHILGVALVFMLICGSVVQAGETSDEDEIGPTMRMYHTFFTAVEPDMVAYFFRNLNKYYPEMSKSHKKFDIISGEQLLREGTLINSEDKVGGQYIRNHFQVTKIESNRYFQLVSESSIMKVGGTFRVPVKTILEYTIEPQLNEKTKVSTKMTIEYHSDIVKLAAWLFGTKGIWRAHVREEMDNARKIIESEQFYWDYQSAKTRGLI